MLGTISASQIHLAKRKKKRKNGKLAEGSFYFLSNAPHVYHVYPFIQKTSGR